LEKEPYAESDPGNQHYIEAPINKYYRSRNVFVSVDYHDPNNNEQGAQGHGLDDAEQIVHTGKTPHPAVNIEKIKTGDFDQNSWWKKSEHLIDEFLGDVEVKADEVGREP
jgi:hypothetical protein